MLPLKMLGLLMLMLSLCDADSRCHDELTLDPPEVVEEYGVEVMVNCSSDRDEHAGMYWSVENIDDAVEYDNSFTSRLVSMSDWHVKAECKIKLNDTYECSKDLKITVYKNPEIVAMFPVNHTATVGETQYELQCDVVEVAPVQNLTVRWYRDNQTIWTDSFTKDTKRLVSESSTLKVNVSRSEDKAQFRCEAQLDFESYGSLPPVSSNVRTLFVHYAPELKNDMEVVTVYADDHVTLNCEAEGHPPPVFHWTHDGEKLMESTNRLNITGVTSTDYNCTATNYLGNPTKQIHVKVIKWRAAPAAITTPQPSTPRGCPLVLTPAEIIVRFGGPASVNCSTSAADVLSIGWESTFGGAVSNSSDTITWAVEKVEEWTIKPLCFINLGDNHQCYTMLNVTLYKTPDIVSISAVDQMLMVEGTEHFLACDVINVAPVQNLKLTWYRGNDIVHTHMVNGTSVTPVNVSSSLRVIPERDYNGALFRCKAELHLGPNGPEPVPTVTSSPHVAVVLYKPRMKACPVQYVGVEHKFSIDSLPCKADGNPAPTIQWSYEGKLINASEPLTRTQSGRYTAELVNELGSIAVSVLIDTEYGPSFSCDDRYEVEENGVLHCAPDGIPKPTVDWFKDGKKVASPPRWTKHDSGNYTLEATNKHGHAASVLHVDVLYAPVLRQGNYSEEVKLGGNVTFDCSADGNPPPEIHWNYSTSVVNVIATTRGSQKSISVTGATSTNAGVYSCVATNKVGSVSRSITLLIKDRPKATKGHIATIWWLLILLIITLIVILVITVHRWKKHGQYSFVPDKANDVPMTPLSNGQQT